MLDKEKDIDAVTISTPDHVHGPAAVYAMEEINMCMYKSLSHIISEKLDY